MLSIRFKEDTLVEIGIDEAGRGSFWGPIMAGAVIIPKESSWTDKQRVLLSQLRDSKKISPKKREKMADEIKELITMFAVGIVTAQEINEKGITWANIEAFRRAVCGLGLATENIPKCRLIIDGTLSIDKWIGDQAQEQEQEQEQELIIEGDSKYMAIAAASILAKVTHDRWITQFCENNTECAGRYDLLKSKGYGTANHREGIRIYGAHELHRVLYIQNWLPGSKHKKKDAPKKDNNQCLIKF